MKLAILNLTGGGISGGYRKYLERLLPVFDRKIGAGSILCVSPAGIPVKDWAGPVSRTEFAECRPFSPLLGAGADLRARVEAFAPDVVFVPIERYFRYPAAPLVSMVLNMAPMAGNYEPGPLSERARHFLQRRFARQAVTRSAHVLAPSRFVKDYLTSEWGLDPGAVSVVYPGAEDTAGLVPARPACVPAGWDKFLWTIGSLERYRGLEDLLAALGDPRLAGAKLLICSSPRKQMQEYYRGLRRQAERLGLGERVVWAGGLSEAEITWCYRNCAAFVMTSRVEAGPNTALEALSAGAVCVAAGNPPLPEFFGEAASYYPPGDGTALAGRLAEALALGPLERERLRALALGRAAQFSWGEAADRMFALFERLAGGGHRPPGVE